MCHITHTQKLKQVFLYLHKKKECHGNFDTKIKQQDNNNKLSQKSNQI